jgi:hypothetical protein
MIDKREVIDHLSLCAECVAMVIHGVEYQGLFNPEEHYERMATEWAEPWSPWYLMVTCDGRSECSTAWFRCDGCGQAINGDRHSGIAIMRDGEE